MTRIKLVHYAYREGQYAGNTGRPRDHNPYTNCNGAVLRDYTDAHAQWNKGWDEARANNG